MYLSCARAGSLYPSLDDHDRGVEFRFFFYHMRSLYHFQFSLSFFSSVCEASSTTVVVDFFYSSLFAYFKEGGITEK